MSENLGHGDRGLPIQKLDESFAKVSLSLGT